MDKRTTDWTDWLEEQHDYAVKILLGIILVFGGMGVLISFFKLATGQTRAINTIYYTVAYVLVLILYFAKGIPDKVRGVAFVVILLSFASMSLYLSWLTGSGRMFLLASVIVATTLISPRAGYICAGISLAIFISFAVAFTNNWLKLGLLLPQTDASPILNEIIGFIMVLGMIFAGQWLFNQSLEAANSANQKIRESQDSFHNIVERSPDGILVIGKEGHVLFVNTAAATFFASPAEAMVGQPVPFTDDFQGKMELEIALPDGEKGTAELTAVQTEWNGEPAFLAMLRDITERKDMEEQVRSLNAELEKRVLERTAQLENTNKELESFSYSVSHDLRAPLRSIDGFGRILQNEYGKELPPEGKRFLGIIRDSAARMSQLIDDLLRLSRIGRSELRQEHVDLSQMARETAERLKAENPERKVEIRIMDDLHLTGDEKLMRIVIENLLNNAWKFTGKNETTLIEVGCMKTSYGENTFFIRDNGVGFDMTLANKLFGAFQRMHTEDEFPGTGIGLALVQRIIHRHGGHLWAESAPGEGAVFYFTVA